jgi:hypothetical protein
MWAKKNLAVAICVVLVIVATDPVIAHHGWSGYDNTQVLNLTGVIQESGYEHPHSYVRLAVPEKIWLVVLAPPSRMERRGVSRDMLAVGTTATVVGIHTGAMRGKCGPSASLFKERPRSYADARSDWTGLVSLA